MRTDENDHVDVHEIRGFMASNVVGALREAYAVSRGTKCKQFMFSLSLSPPEPEYVSISIFEQTIEEIEKQLGLTGQPRVIVFHEKFGRRHAHCVWSRINAEKMTAINLPHFKLKLQEVSRQLYIDHQWHMPRGFVKGEECDPLNFSLSEWQQAKRMKRDPKVIKQMFQDCWAISDNLGGFRKALETRGYYLAQGDRRGHVAVDWKGEIYSITRWTGVSSGHVSAKLGDPSELPTVDATKKKILEHVTARFDHLAKDEKHTLLWQRGYFWQLRQQMVDRHRSERTEQKEMSDGEWTRLRLECAQRFRKGLKGVFDWMTGRTKIIRDKNALQMHLAKARAEKEREALVRTQLLERRTLQNRIREQRLHYEGEIAHIERQAQEYTESLGLWVPHSEPTRPSDKVQKRRSRSLSL